jgi:hypothetical protein
MSLEKNCFVASSIGEEGSPARELANEKFDLVFDPVLTDLQYKVYRADKETTPNSISRDIINRIIKSELMLADVSDNNPNVFYELAVRNAIKKPVIIIKTPSQKLAFDIQDKRAISLDMRINRQWSDAKKLLREYIVNAEKDPNSASVSILSDFEFKINDEKRSNDQMRELDISITLKDIKDSIMDLTRIVRSVDSSKSTLRISSANAQTLLPTRDMGLHFSDIGTALNSIIIDISEFLGPFGSVQSLGYGLLTVHGLLEYIANRIALSNPVEGSLNQYGRTWILEDRDTSERFQFIGPNSIFATMSDVGMMRDNRKLDEAGIRANSYLIVKKL